MKSKALTNLFERSDLIARMANESVWDVVVIGGGASGLGVALDAVSRGFKTLLLEQSDFAKGTSSKSTKLVHGGVRYLAQGNVDLVREALHERGLLLRNAPHLVKNQSFIIPNYEWWGGAFYLIGLKLYDWLAGKLSLGKSEHVSKKTLSERIPSLVTAGLRGGVLYHDGQFDDARMAVNLAQTCIEYGGVALNYFPVTGLEKNAEGRIVQVLAKDNETGRPYRIAARSVVNATGVFVNTVLEMDAPGRLPVVRPSQGAHIVLDRSFLRSDTAVMIPKTEDGRVLFAIPWHNRVIIGTTDTPVVSESLDPRPLEEEIDFILKTAARYLAKPPRREDVLSTYAGLRPLAATRQSEGEKTKEISRSHKILVEPSGLVTITGGKWTTFRRMGQDTMDRVIAVNGLPVRPSETRNLPVHGAVVLKEEERADHRSVYGADRLLLQELLRENPEWAAPVHPGLEFTYAEVILAIRNEMARTTEDILARRVRVLFLDARAALEIAPAITAVLAAELGRDNRWIAEELARFEKVARGFLVTEPNLQTM